MASSKYQAIRAQNLQASFRTQKRKRNFIFQRDNNKKAQIQVNQGMASEKENQRLGKAQSPDLNATENLWPRAVNKRSEGA